MPIRASSTRATIERLWLAAALAAIAAALILAGWGLHGSASNPAEGSAIADISEQFHVFVSDASVPIKFDLLAVSGGKAGFGDLFVMPGQLKPPLTVLVTSTAKPQTATCSFQDLGNYSFYNVGPKQREPALPRELTREQAPSRCQHYATPTD